jgi:xanthine dehydrogenase accessory factor
VYEIALTVAACLRAGTQVDVAWVVENHGFSSREPGEAIALTPGGGRVGTLLAGALNDQLAALSAEGLAGRLVDCDVSDLDAGAVGLSCGGRARCLLVTATDLPGELWDALRDREPVCLVTELDGDRLARTMMYTGSSIGEAGEDAAQRFTRAASDVTLTAERVVTVLWPVPRLVVVGAGSIADALQAAAGLLGWHTQVVDDVDEAPALIEALTPMDNVVVLSHDDEIGGHALATALSGDVGYIGALGSRRTQRSRADWLAGHGITDLERVHGPAGLDIGANTPAEIAVSIAAEILAGRSGSKPRSLRERAGAIHQPPT